MILIQLKEVTKRKLEQDQIDFFIRYFSSRICEAEVEFSGVYKGHKGQFFLSEQTP